MTEVRCPGCTRFLLKYQGDGDIFIVIPCKRCKATIEVCNATIVFRPREELLTLPAA